MLARGLDQLSRRYGRAPHEWLEMDDVNFALAWSVMSRAEAQEDG